MRIVLTTILAIFSIIPFTLKGQVYVNGYYRSNGTYVQPHMRSNPNSSPYDNYSFPGNVNPYTGKVATGNPDTYIQNLYKDRNVTSSSPNAWVSGYHRGDGVYVPGHYSSVSSGNSYGNYSYPNSSVKTQPAGQTDSRMDMFGYGNWDLPKSYPNTQNPFENSSHSPQVLTEQGKKALGVSDIDLLRGKEDKNMLSPQEFEDSFNAIFFEGIVDRRTPTAIAVDAPKDALKKVSPEKYVPKYPTYYIGRDNGKIYAQKRSEEFRSQRDYWAGIILIIAIVGFVYFGLKKLTGGMTGNLNQPVPPPPPVSTYHVALNKQQLGQFSLEQLKQSAQSGQFTKNHHVWKEGMANWELASNVAEFASLFSSVPPPLPAI